MNLYLFGFFFFTILSNQKSNVSLRGGEEGGWVITLGNDTSSTFLWWFFRKLTETEISLIRTGHNSILARCERFISHVFNYFH